jgi:hypothetical protein
MPHHAIEPVDRLRWFAGDKDALDLYERLSFIAHAWDDLIDQDKPVNINELMANLLLYLPCNPCYRRFELEIRSLIIPAIVSYQAANIMERSGDDHRIELAHYLRYAVFNIAAFLIGALNGISRGAEILAVAAPTMIPERVADYMKEHSHAA